jgi:hypothetical protein
MPRHKGVESSRPVPLHEDAVRCLSRVGNEMHRVAECQSMCELGMLAAARMAGASPECIAAIEAIEQMRFAIGGSDG